jgi:hypothetical protein
MSVSNTRRLLVLLLLLGLAFRLVFVAQDMRQLVTRGPLYDDSFYCFEIARNIARGAGSTFDGRDATNGYQPLYVFLLVPLYVLAGDHATAPIYIALCVSAVLNVLTGWILFRLVRRDAGDLPALFGLVLWSFGPAIVRQAVNGLETSLAMFLLAATLEYYLTVYRSEPLASPRRAATLGLLLGLAVLARVDAALFALALGFDVWRRRRPGAWRRAAVAAAVAAALVVPWCIASYQVAGSVFPDSGRATRFLSAAYAPHDRPQLAGASFESGPPSSFLLDNFLRSVLQLGTSPVVQIYARGVERLSRPLHLQGSAALVLIAVLLLAGGVALWAAARRLHIQRPWMQRDYRFLFVYSALLLAAYSFWVFGQIFYGRYYYPVFFFSIVLGAFAFDLLLQVLPRPRRSLVAGTLVGLYAVLLPYMCLHRIQNGNYRFLHVVDWIESHTSPDATIGVFNSGAIAYFSDRRIVNLDGKVNPQALAALRAGRMPDYLEAAGIEYVIDHEWIVGRFLPLGGRPGSVRLARIDGARALGVPGWGAFRVQRAGEAVDAAQAAGAPPPPDVSTRR